MPRAAPPGQSTREAPGSLSPAREQCRAECYSSCSGANFADDDSPSTSRSTGHEQASILRPSSVATKVPRDCIESSGWHPTSARVERPIIPSASRRLEPPTATGITCGPTRSITRHSAPEVGALRVVARPSKCAVSRCGPHRWQLDSLGSVVRFGDTALMPDETSVESGAEVAKL